MGAFIAGWHGNQTSTLYNERTNEQTTNQPDTESVSAEYAVYNRRTVGRNFRNLQKKKILNELHVKNFVF